MGIITERHKRQQTQKPSIYTGIAPTAPHPTHNRGPLGQQLKLQEEPEPPPPLKSYAENLLTNGCKSKSQPE